jgi:hypothetical protein
MYLSVEREFTRGQGMSLFEALAHSQSTDTKAQWATILMPSGMRYEVCTDGARWKVLVGGIEAVFASREEVEAELVRAHIPVARRWQPGLWRGDTLLQIQLLR